MNYKQTYIGVAFQVENNTGFSPYDYDGFNESLMPVNQNNDSNTEYFVPNIDSEKYGIYDDRDDDSQVVILNELSEWRSNFNNDFLAQMALIYKHFGNGKVVTIFITGYV